MVRNAISRQLIDIIKETAVRNKARKVKKITLVAGEEAVISRELLEHFALMAKGTASEGALVEIKKEQTRIKCETCRIFYRPRGGNAACPRCGRVGREFVLGRRFFVESLKIEI